MPDENLALCGEPMRCPHGRAGACGREEHHPDECAMWCDLCLLALLAAAQVGEEAPEPQAQQPEPISNQALRVLLVAVRRQRTVPVRGVLRLYARLQRAEAVILDALAVGTTRAHLPGKDGADMRRALQQYPFLPRSANDASGGAQPPAEGK